MRPHPKELALMLMVSIGTVAAGQDVTIKSVAAGNPPNPLATCDGSEVTTAEAWREKVRPQTLRTFREQV